MAKRKAEDRDKPARKAKTGASLFLRRLRLLVSLVLVGFILALIVWQWTAIVSWVGNLILATLLSFGWGLVIVVSAIATLIGVVRSRKLSSVARHWNCWLAGVVLATTVWGILAFIPSQGVLRPVNLGGTIGLSIVGYPDFIGILRIAGLILVAIFLIAPRASFRLTGKSISGSFRWLKARLARHPAQPKKPTKAPQSTQTIPESTDTEKKETAQEAAPPQQAQPDLRQVAQEVWKKYGESSALVTVDGWRLPPIDILDRTTEVEFSEADNVKRARLIEEALGSYGVEAKVVQINPGPTVTQFGVEPGWDRKVREIREKDKDGSISLKQEEVSKTRVKVDRITSLANDLALALAAASIRIEAPVPGKSVVGIEVPNTTSSLVSLRGVIETSVFQKTKIKSKLCLALGKGAGGEAVAADLSKMPHLLIAGATGSGKTVCLNTIICCLLMHQSPNDVRFIMIDPKRVELTPFNSIPHLATPVIVDVNKALDVLRWLNQEMDSRYQKLAKVGARNIEAFNKNKQGEEKMPYLVLIIDELADLMMTSLEEVEHILCRLAQLARATGIHLVVATQRPSVDVVTGLIKANFPTRISFAVTSQVDSRTILDSAGAEKLLGKGDMLFMPTDAAKPKRLQGCFASDAETERLVFFWASQHQKETIQLKIDDFVPPQATDKKRDIPEDSLLQQARALLKEHQHVSTSFLQRRLRIGYPRAARLMEQLEEEDAESTEEPE